MLDAVLVVLASLSLRKRDDTGAFFVTSSSARGINYRKALWSDAAGQSLLMVATLDAYQQALRNIFLVVFSFRVNSRMLRFLTDEALHVLSSSRVNGETILGLQCSGKAVVS
jgi:hypothetical protein